MSERVPTLRRLSTVVLATLATAVAMHPSQEADVFFHITLGQSVLEHMARVVPEPSAFPGFEPMCVVPAWLWDVLAYGVHRVAGFEGLSLLNLGFAFLCAWLVTRLARAYAPNDGWLAWLTVCALTLICVSTRFALRPQTLAFAVLAGYLLLLHGYATQAPSSQRTRGVALVALALLWAQLHGSFVLAPVLFVIAVAGAYLEGHRDALLRQPRTVLAVLGALLLTLFSSAAGFGITSYISEHGYGDAVQFIAEMAPPRWVDLVGLQGAYGKALVGLWLLSLVGLTQQGRFQWTAIGFALVGHLLLSRAHRFVAEDAILCVPLAASGAANVATWAVQVVAPALRRPLHAACVVTLVALFGQQLQDSLRGYGGRFGIGLDETAFPRLSATYLQRLPEGSRVLSAFMAGPALALWTHGKLRTYVDGRTPMYFDDADYAVARDVFTDPDALDRALRRFTPSAAVVDRAHGVCDLLAKRWHPVVIEGRYSTFMPPQAGVTPLRGLDPCGPEFVRRSTVQLDVLDHNLSRLSKLGRSRFLDMLRAERQLLASPPQPTRALQLLDASTSNVYGAYHRRLRIAALVTAGRLDDAYQTMLAALHDGDVSVLSLMAMPQLGTLDLQRARSLLELAVERLGEATPPTTRSMLAAMCVHANDAACARYQALRAAAKGAPNVEPSLAWLSEHAKTARMRDDARAWLDLLQRERQAPAP